MLPDSNCIVERSQTPSFFDSSRTQHAGGKVVFYLNCNGPWRPPAWRVIRQPARRAVAELARQAEEAAKQAAEEQNAHAELHDTNNAPGVPGA